MDLYPRVPFKSTRRDIIHPLMVQDRRVSVEAWQDWVAELRHRGWLCSCFEWNMSTIIDGFLDDELGRMKIRKGKEGDEKVERGGVTEEEMG